MDGDEGAQAFGVDEGGAGQIDFDEFVFGLEGGADQFAEERGLISAKVLDTGDDQGVTTGFSFHDGRGGGWEWGLLARDFEDAVHAGQFEDLLNLGGRVQDPDMSAAGGHGFVQGDQGAQAGAVEEPGLAELEVDPCVVVAQGCPGLVPEEPALAALSSANPETRRTVS